MSAAKVDKKLQRLADRVFKNAVVTSAAAQLKRERWRAVRERQNAIFYKTWKALGGPELHAEGKLLAPTYQYAFDFAHDASRVAFEIQGGQWMAKGSHGTGGARRRDCLKSLRAQLEGWSVIHLTPDLFTEEIFKDLFDHIARREGGYFH